ncbi:MAG: helix-turn-helix transcriptional regulator [Methanosarcinales archaeon]|nr:helix-turn-helix transcriptional regulator [Methanosarcinales archaeon]
MDCLTRLTGDQERAAERIRRLCLLTERIDADDGACDVSVFKALADPCRLKILHLLKEGEFCVCEIMAALDRPQSTTSHHLSILREAGLIKERKEGKWCHYRLADGAVLNLLSYSRLLKI